MITKQTYNYADGYINDKILIKFDSDSEIRTAYRSLVLAGDFTPESLINFINSYLDDKTKARLFAACRKFISRQKLARNNDGQRETTIKLTPSDKQILEKMAQYFDVSMVEALHVAIRHLSDSKKSIRCEAFEKYSNSDMSQTKNIPTINQEPDRPFKPRFKKITPQFSYFYVQDGKLQLLVPPLTSIQLRLSGIDCVHFDKVDKKFNKQAMTLIDARNAELASQYNEKVKAWNAIAPSLNEEQLEMAL